MRAQTLLLVLLALAACDSDPVAPVSAQRVELLTDKRTYYQSVGPTINVVLANVSDRALYIAAASFDTVLDRRVGDEWIEVGAWYGVVAAGPFPTELEPGTYRTWPRLTVSEPLFSLKPGAYRIRTKVYEDEGLVHLLPEDERVSPVFEIVEE